MYAYRAKHLHSLVHGNQSQILIPDFRCDRCDLPENIHFENNNQEVIYLFDEEDELSKLRIIAAGDET